MWSRTGRQIEADRNEVDDRWGSSGQGDVIPSEWITTNDARQNKRGDPFASSWAWRTNSQRGPSQPGSPLSCESHGSECEE
jgi:hypothetical protein